MKDVMYYYAVKTNLNSEISDFFITHSHTDSSMHT